MQRLSAARARPAAAQTRRLGPAVAADPAAAAVRADDGRRLLHGVGALRAAGVPVVVPAVLWRRARELEPAVHRARRAERRLVSGPVHPRARGGPRRPLQRHDCHAVAVWPDDARALAARRAPAGRQPCPHPARARIRSDVRLRVRLEYQYHARLCRAAVQHERVWTLLCDVLLHRGAGHADGDPDCRSANWCL